MVGKVHLHSACCLGQIHDGLGDITHSDRNSLIGIFIEKSLSGLGDIHGPIGSMDTWRYRVFSAHVNDIRSPGCCEPPWEADLLWSDGIPGFNPYRL